VRGSPFVKLECVCQLAPWNALRHHTLWCVWSVVCRGVPSGAHQFAHWRSSHSDTCSYHLSGLGGRLPVTPAPASAMARPPPLPRGCMRATALVLLHLCALVSAHSGGCRGCLCGVTLPFARGLCAQIPTGCSSSLPGSCGQKVCVCVWTRAAMHPR
jgi:hypothetical protein